MKYKCVWIKKWKKRVSPLNNIYKIKAGRATKHNSSKEIFRQTLVHHNAIKEATGPKVRKVVLNLHVCVCV